MNASIHIAVLLCVVLIETQQTHDTNIANSHLQNDNNNRGKRQPDTSAVRFPSKCNRVILSCCADTEQRQKKCFSNLQCAQTYERGNACAKENVLKVLDAFDQYTNSNNGQVRRKRWNYYNENPQPRFQSRRGAIPNQQEEYLPHIVRLLEEITTYVKKPQTVSIPRPIYVPYPVPYPVTQSVQQTNVETFKVPNIKTRGFPTEDGTTRDSAKSSGGDDKDGARPISFDPIKPDRSLTRLAPNVERGTVQGVRLPSPSQTAVSTISIPPPNVQSPCAAAILACCSEIKKQQGNCFYRFQCGLPYDNGNACKSDSIRAAFDSYQTTHLG